MKNYLLLRVDNHDIKFVDALQADSMADAINQGVEQSKAIPNDDRWFVVHGYEIKSE